MVTLASLVVFLRLNQSAPAPRAASLLPDSTALLLAIPDLARARAGFEGTAACALWQEPQVQVLAQDVNRAFMELLGAPKGKERHPAFLPSLFAPAEGEVFLAITELSAQPRPHGKAVLGMDVRRNLLATKIALAYREFRIRTWNRTARFYTKTLGAVDCRVWELNPHLRIYHAFLNSLLVYTHDEETLRAMIARFAGQAGADFKPLAASPAYCEALARVRPLPEIVAYANPSRFRQAPPWLTRAEPLMLGTTFLNSQLRDLRYSRRAATAAALSPPRRWQTMTLTTPHTACYRAGVTDWENAYRELADTLAASGDRALMSRLTQFERALRHNGIRPREDLFRMLGPETALLANWREGARLPDAALVIELQNPEPMRLRLDVAMTALKSATDNAPPWDVTRFHDETLRTLRLPTTAFAPTYFVTDKFFVLASSPDYARDLVNRLKDTAPTLATTDEYQESLKRLPANATAYTYCNLRAVVPPLLAEARNGIAACPNLFFRAEKLPAPEILTPHLAPLVSATWEDNQGKTVITISPLGKPATMMFGALAAWFAARPHLHPTPAVPTTSSSTRPRGNPTAPPQTPTR